MLALSETDRETRVIAFRLPLANFDQLAKMAQDQADGNMSATVRQLLARGMAAMKQSEDHRCTTKA